MNVIINSDRINILMGQSWHILSYCSGIRVHRLKTITINLMKYSRPTKWHSELVPSPPPQKEKHTASPLR